MTTGGSLTRVVDTNVPLIANGRSTASRGCVAACAVRLRGICAGGCIVIDDGWHVLSEYLHKLRPSGQPGPGDAFLKWVLTNQANARRCVRVRITPRKDGPQSFCEVPGELDALGIDPSDLKFIAVAAAHPDRPPICQGLDSKWWGWRDELAKARIHVEFPCPEEIARLFEKKMGSQ